MELLYSIQDMATELMRNQYVHIATPLVIYTLFVIFGKNDLKVVGSVLVIVTILYELNAFLDTPYWASIMYINQIGIKFVAIYIIFKLAIRFYGGHTMISIYTLLVLLIELFFIAGLYGGIKIPKMYNSFNNADNWKKVMRIKDKMSYYDDNLTEKQKVLKLTKKEQEVKRQAEQDGVWEEVVAPFNWFYDNYYYVQMIEYLKLFAFLFIVRRKTIITDIINRRLSVGYVSN